MIIISEKQPLPNIIINYSAVKQDQRHKYKERKKNMNNVGASLPLPPDKKENNNMNTSIAQKTSENRAQRRNKTKGLSNLTVSLECWSHHQMDGGLFSSLPNLEHLTYHRDHETEGVGFHMKRGAQIHLLCSQFAFTMV